MTQMDADRPIIFEGKPGLCWHCGFGELVSSEFRVLGKECGQWKATSPVAVPDCRVFLDMGGHEAAPEQGKEIENG
jgi:hypothetical protein